MYVAGSLAGGWRCALTGGEGWGVGPCALTGVRGGPFGPIYSPGTWVMGVWASCTHRARGSPSTAPARYETAALRPGPGQRRRGAAMVHGTWAPVPTARTQGPDPPGRWGAVPIYVGGVAGGPFSAWLDAQSGRSARRSRPPCQAGAWGPDASIRVPGISTGPGLSEPHTVPTTPRRPRTVRLPHRPGRVSRTRPTWEDGVRARRILRDRTS
jgi:hypothetical protein